MWRKSWKCPSAYPRKLTPTSFVILHAYSVRPGASGTVSWSDQPVGICHPALHTSLAWTFLGRHATSPGVSAGDNCLATWRVTNADRGVSAERKNAIRTFGAHTAASEIRSLWCSPTPGIIGAFDDGRTGASARDRVAPLNSNATRARLQAFSMEFVPSSHGLIAVPVPKGSLRTLRKVCQ